MGPRPGVPVLTRPSGVSYRFPVLKHKTQSPPTGTEENKTVLFIGEENLSARERLKRMDVEHSGLKYWPCQLLGEWPWASHL